MSSKRKKHQSPLVAAALGSSQKQTSKKKNKRKQQEINDESEEQRLTALLFGGGAPTSASSAPEEVIPPKSKDMVDQDQLFEIDVEGDGIDDEKDSKRKWNTNYDNSDEVDDDDNKQSQHDTKKPAWVDDDDDDDDKDDTKAGVNLLQTNRLKKLRKAKHEEGVSNMQTKELEMRLRKRFQQTTMVSARTDWADIRQAEEPKEEGEIASTTPLLASSRTKLRPHVLQVVRCPDANLVEPNQASVQAVEFHPGSDPDRPLMLTAGLDKTLRFFSVDPDASQKIHGIHFSKLPIYSAHFLGDSGNVVVSGRRSFFYIYDAAAGKLELVNRIMGRKEKSLEKCVASPDGRTIAFLGNDGYVILVDTKTKQWMADLKLNGSVRAVSFTPDSTQILASGSDGDVYRFDLRTRRCLSRFSNQDGTITSSLSLTTKSMAVGAESGVVNLYSSSGERIKSIMNLQTSCDFAKFNHDGQILAFSSRRERNTLKLLHAASGSVFSNWPTTKTPLDYVWSLDFSPQSKFLAIGNDKGKCLLYKLNHYHQNAA